MGGAVRGGGSAELTEQQQAVDQRDRGLGLGATGVGVALEQLGGPVDPGLDVTSSTCPVPAPAASTPRRHLSVEQHIRTVRAILGLLDLEDVAVVGHDSGGLIARHALVGDPRLRALVLLDTEQPAGLSLRFRSFLAVRHLPGFGGGLGRALARPRVRRLPFVLGGAFADPRMLDGEFDEFFLRPLHEDAARRDAAVRLLRSFDPQHVRDLAEVHARIDTPVQLIWGAEDAFFPLRWAEEMVSTFPRAALEVVPGAGLFVHEERPHEVASALLRAVQN